MPSSPIADALADALNLSQSVAASQITPIAKSAAAAEPSGKPAAFNLTTDGRATPPMPISDELAASLAKQALERNKQTALGLCQFLLRLKAALPAERFATFASSIEASAAKSELFCNGRRG